MNKVKLNRILLIVLILLCVSLCCVACGNDANDEPKQSQSAATEAPTIGSNDLPEDIFNTSEIETTASPSAEGVATNSPERTDSSAPVQSAAPTKTPTVAPTQTPTPTKSPANTSSPAKTSKPSGGVMLPPDYL